MTSPTLRLYAYWRSSSAWRVRIGLALKGLPYEVRSVDLAAGEQWGEAQRERNPTHQVPVLEVEALEGLEPRATGGAGPAGSAGLSGSLQGAPRPPLRLVQSMAILEWLDERFPAPPLLPPDPEGRARVRALAEHVNSGIQPLQNAVVLRALRDKVPGWDRDWARNVISVGLAALERALDDGGSGRFVHGDAPGLADCYLVPQLYNARRFDVEVRPFTRLLRIEAHCEALPAFQAAHPDRQPDAPARQAPAQPGAPTGLAGPASTGTGSTSSRSR